MVLKFFSHLLFSSVNLGIANLETYGPDAVILRDLTETIGRDSGLSIMNFKYLAKYIHHNSIHNK
jgi:hypothetical protein